MREWHSFEIDGHNLIDKQRRTVRLSFEAHRLITSIAGQGSDLWWWPMDFERCAAEGDVWVWTLVDSLGGGVFKSIRFYFKNPAHAIYFKLLLS